MVSGDVPVDTSQTGVGIVGLFIADLLTIEKVEHCLGAGAQSRASVREIGEQNLTWRPETLLLVSKKPEGPVLLDRAANRAAELMLCRRQCGVNWRHLSTQYLLQSLREIVPPRQAARADQVEG